MNTDQILALAPGEQLDEAIHKYVFGGDGMGARYSTSDTAGALILDRLPLFVGRVDGGPRYTPTRPWLAGILAFEPSANAYVPKLSVTAPTRLVALCKAALLVVFQPAKPAKAARPSSEQDAKAVAARIGTPGARNPAAGVAAALASADQRKAARRKLEVKAAKKAARAAGVPYVEPPAPADGAEAERRPPAQPQRRAQPAVFTGERGRREPMPSRPREFIAPKPIDTGGNERGAT